MQLTSPDGFYQATFSRLTSELRQRLDQSAIEMVTGRKQNATAAVRGANGTLLRAQAAVDAAEPARARAAVLEGRYRMAGSALETIRELTSNAGLSGSAAGDIVSGGEAESFAAVEARSALGSVFSALEARFGGRSLFGGTLGTGQVLEDVGSYLSGVSATIGSSTTAAGVEAAIDAYLAAGGGFETDIYRGGTPAGEPELAGGQRLGELLTADSDEMRQLYRGLTMIAFNEQVDAAERPGFLREAAELVEGAKDRLIAKEAEIGLSLNTIDRERERLDTELYDAELTIDSILGRDPFEAASETQDLETRLQAAYTVTSRISNLRLTNYLR